MRVPTSALAAVAGVVLLTTPPVAAAQDSAPRAPATPAGRLLDVPFLPQTEDLCGGAAVAMVLRYWGAGTRPDEFAALIDPAQDGIPADVLAADVRRRGWTSLPFQGGSREAALDEVRGHVNAGRPVVALIAVGPARYHYVVVVAATGESLVVHDPARAPFRVLTATAFDEAWAASGRWALLVLPSAQGSGISDHEPRRPAASAGTTPAPAPDADHARTSACAPWVDDLVAQARAGDLPGAGAGLEAAGAVCPEAATVWRELAGVRFLQQRWTDAASLARRATTLDAHDDGGWDLLATSLFLDGRPDDALGAWNAIGRPQVDVVQVSGARRTRHPVIAGLVGLEPRAMLTPATFARAARRLDALPSAHTTSLRYRPVDGGLATLEAAVVERRVVPRGLGTVAAMAAQAAILREARLTLASPAGQGERWSAAWRWWDRRPRVAVGLAFPMAAGWPGITTIDGLWERASYATPDASTGVTRLERARAGLHLSDWASGRLRWTAGAALDRWGAQRYGSLEAGVDLRLADDRVALESTVAGWAARAARDAGFARTSLTLAARSTARPDRAAWLALAGATGVSAGAPLDLWPGAGLGLARAPLLRAHPLLDDGVIAGDVFGRRLLHGTLEYRRTVRSTPVGHVVVAGFSDTARAWRTLRGGGWHSDAGVGLRLVLPADAGTLRVDLARGLRDGRHVLSAGWSTAWPDR